MQMIEEITLLIKKAEQAEKSDDALKFSQAACNAANALRCIQEVDLWGKGDEIPDNDTTPRT